MKIRNVITSVLMTGCVLLLPTCGQVKHGYEKYILRGSIVKKKGMVVTVAIGSADATLVGRTLQVYRMEGPSRESTADGSGYITPNRPESERISRGKIRVVRLVGTTMAEAQIVEGLADVNDLVDLRNPVK